MVTQDKNKAYKKYRKSAGKCPVCLANLAQTKEELFEQLGITEEASKNGVTETDIKKAFREKAKEVHPDKGGSPTDFFELSDAKSELLDMVREDLDPLNMRLNESHNQTLTREQFIEVVKSVHNLKQAYMQNPRGPCPYCKRRKR